MAQKLQVGRKAGDAKVESTHSRWPVVHLRLTKWTKDRLNECVARGEYRTLGAAADGIIKAYLAGQDGQPVDALPESRDDIRTYYPIMAQDMRGGVWGGLGEQERRLCVLVAFFPSVNDVELSRWVGCTPGKVKAFRVSNLGLEAIRVGEERRVLSERLRYWTRQLQQAEDTQHPHSKQSDYLLGSKLFAPASKKEILKRVAGGKDTTAPLGPMQMDQEFMAHADRIKMTPARYLQLYAARENMTVQEVLAPLVERFMTNE